MSLIDIPQTMKPLIVWCWKLIVSLNIAYGINNKIDVNMLRFELELFNLIHIFITINNENDQL